MGNLIDRTIIWAVLLNKNMDNTEINSEMKALAKDLGVVLIESPKPKRVFEFYLLGISLKIEWL